MGILAQFIVLLTLICLGIGTFVIMIFATTDIHKIKRYSDLLKYSINFIPIINTFPYIIGIKFIEYFNKSL